MPTPCHILVEGNPVIVYASRNGSPNKILPILKPFLEKFWQEREIHGEYDYTADCLVAQIVVRFGYEICEDDFSNLRVGVNYDPSVEYIYAIAPQDRQINIWVPQDKYRHYPSVGLQGCDRTGTEEW
ncbi:MAG TPA: histidine kinase [Cyanobacteria bacterium UBA11372]|nr:histidine kinase [Cyanobacteria bacterium UBA11372]